MSKAQVFLDLQAKVNQEIDELGQATNESANQLESLSNELTDEEIDEVCEKARAQSMYEQGLRHY
jgi:ClpP class serine protease